MRRKKADDERAKKRMQNLNEEVSDRAVLVHRQARVLGIAFTLSDCQKENNMFAYFVNNTM